MANFMVCSATKLEKVEKTEFGLSFTALPLTSVHASETVEIKTIDDILAAAKAYQAKVDASGNPAALSFWKSRKSTGRAFSNMEATISAANRRFRFANADKVTV